jgi:AraC family transcriptional regulator
MRGASTAVTPHEWAAQLSGAPDLSSESGPWDTALLRHWTGTSPVMEQPCLDHHYVVQHLGGAKHVERRCDGPAISTPVANGSLTIVPAGTQFKWNTRGPIEFAHLYISPTLLAQTAARFDKAHEVSLVDRVGIVDPLLSALFCSMLGEIRAPSMQDPLYLDSLLEVFMLRLALSQCSLRLRPPRSRETLSPMGVKRVAEFVESHLGAPIRLSDLARVSGASAFHFCRAFRNSTGESPYRFVVRRRIERARHMLSSTDSTLEAIARACGFKTVASFCKTFARVSGETPKRCRDRLAAGPKS